MDLMILQSFLCSNCKQVVKRLHLYGSVSDIASFPDSPRTQTAFPYCKRRKVGQGLGTRPYQTALLSKVKKLFKLQ